MRFQECLIAWTPGNAQTEEFVPATIEIGCHPDNGGWSSHYTKRVGGGEPRWNTLSDHECKTELFELFEQIVREDNIPEAKVRRAFLMIDEYRSMSESTSAGMRQ